ncbi:hypothetical protein BDR26DRAFT_637871 [Obelidium mucronatum]|nr:hypothetical protein BDR26DRAFT_637871 [Obelidium mucronatum]
MEAQSNRISYLESELSKYSSASNTSETSLLDLLLPPPQNYSHPTQPCSTCQARINKLEQRNKYLEDQLAQFHVQYERLFEQSQKESQGEGVENHPARNLIQFPSAEVAGAVVPNSNPMDSESRISSADSVSSTSQDDPIPSSESLFGPLQLSPYLTQFQNLVSIGPKRGYELVDILIGLSRATTRREIRIKMMQLVAVKDQMLDACRLLDRARFVDIFEGVKEANGAHSRYFAENMGKPEGSGLAGLSPSPPSIDNQEKRADILRQLQPAKESLLLIPSFRIVRSLVDQLVNQFADRLMSYGTVDYEDRFVAFNETVDVMHRVCAAGEDRAKFILAVEVMRETGKAFRSSLAQV